MKIYTRTGDSGDTALLGGNRVSKDDVRIIAYGDVDELNSSIGLTVAQEPREMALQLLEQIQADLFSIGANLASPDPNKVKNALVKARIDDSAIERLEQAIDDTESSLDPLKTFILPGGTTKSAQFHVARTICRRAERSIVRLAQQTDVPEIIVRYINRLSDLLFVLGRLANKKAGIKDKAW
jgi:cob(I)alamin adenosyltransferase